MKSRVANSTPTSAILPTPLRLGFLPLTDAAPLIVAEHRGLFKNHGLHVVLRREIGWATIREKIIYGELDAAQAPAPMLWAIHHGLDCTPREVLTALVLNLNGNALTLSRTLWEAGVRDSSTFRTHARERRRQKPLTLGVVFQHSSHHLLLLSWLRAAGVDPARDVHIVVVPPAQMFRNLAAGTIDGYCAGEPWNTLAVREDIGWCPTWSAAQAPGHVEKILMVTARFAKTRPAEHLALVAALTEACTWCDEPQNREALAELLSDARYLNIPARVIAPALLGRFACGHDHVEQVPDFHIFAGGDANVPTTAKAIALQTELVAAGLLPRAMVSAEIPGQLFREDLYRSALSLNSHHVHTK